MQEFTPWQVALLGYQSLGVVYGDIGTSPLYTFSSFTLPDPDKHDLLGILSLILWTLTLVSLVKYVFIVLHADDHGEGMYAYVLARARCLCANHLNPSVFFLLMDIVLKRGAGF